MVKRAEYLAGSFSRQQPWLAEGISRRTWERRRRKITASAPTKGARTPRRRDLNANVGSPASNAPRAAVGPADDISPVPAHKRTVRRDAEDLLLQRIHAYCDEQGLTPTDQQALAKAFHAITLPELFKQMDRRALGKVYRRARKRLPVGYDRWIGLVKKWDNSYTSQRARNLVDRLVTAIGNRPRNILDKLFEHLDQQFCENWSKKVKRLESDCERLEKDDYYMPRMRDLKKDDLPDRIYAELGSGPRTKNQLAKKFGRTCNAILAVGQHLRDAGLIEIITSGGRFMWARAGTAPPFVLARDAIIAALKEGPMNVTALAEKIGKARVTVVKALQSDLLRNKEVERTKRGIYALRGTEPPYISKRDAILSALKKGPMNISTLCQITCSAPYSIYQFIRPLLASRRIIRTKRGLYALRGAAPLFVTTDDAIIRALRRRPMRLRALVQRINKSPNINVAESTVIGVLARLKKAGTVKHEGWGGEYHLARRAERGAALLRRPTPSK